MVDLLTAYQTSLPSKQVMQRRQILDRVVSIVKMIGKREKSYRGTGSSEAVSTLLYVMKKLITEHYYILYFFLRSTITFLSVIWKMLLKNVCKTNPTSTSITVLTEIHLSPKLLLTLLVLLRYIQANERRNFKLYWRNRHLLSSSRFNSKYNFSRQMLSYSMLCLRKRQRTTSCRY